MSLNLEDIINQVKQVEETKSKQEKNIFNGDPRVLRFKKNCTYTVRLLPNIKDVSNTFVTYKEIGWKSLTGGPYIDGGRSPQDAGIKNDLYNSTQWNHYSKAKEAGDEAEKKKSYSLLPHRKQLVNAYLIDVEGDDSDAKERRGSVVVLRYPAQADREGNPLSDVYKRIHSAIFGDMSKKIGTKALDLSAKGKSLMIKVTVKAEYSNYSETSFDDAEDLGLSETEITEILNSVYDLNEFVPEVKSSEEIKTLLDQHWFGESASPSDELDDDELPPPASPSPRSAQSKSVSKKSDDEIPMGDSSDDDLDELLKDI